MAITLSPQVQWMAPAPLWQGLASTPDTDNASRTRLRQPEILRFATDSFMDEYMAMLASQSWRFGEWHARPETWRDPAVTPGAVEAFSPIPALAQVQRKTSLAARMGIGVAIAPDPILPPRSAPRPTRLKLYQPAQQRFYLLTACLVCRLPGLPDRILDTSANERTLFVVRRLRARDEVAASRPDFEYNTTTCDEFAFVTTPQGQRWQAVVSELNTRADSFVTGEEANLMFGTNYQESDGRRRRVLGGMIPVGKRETYLGVPLPQSPSAGQPPTPIDPRKALFMSQIGDPWRNLVDLERQTLGNVNRDSGVTGTASPEQITKEQRKRKLELRDQVTLVSWYILLDLADYLEKYLPDVWKVATGQAPENTLLGAKSTLFAHLKNAHVTDKLDPDSTTETGVDRTLQSVLAVIQGWRTQLEGNTSPYTTLQLNPATKLVDQIVEPAGWPNFRYQLSASGIAEMVKLPDGVESPTLDTYVEDAFAADAPPADTPPLPLMAQISGSGAPEPGWFIIRCVFERPHCGPLQPTVVSEATAAFQLASFFDSDAPARPIRIPLPFDPSPGGLRKFDKNTAFLLSDALCGHVQRMKSLSFLDLVLSVLPWPLHKDLSVPDEGPCLSFGLICSLSIPIITICALILLIIIVNLLDVIFKWMPYFIMCFPLPKFSAKQAE